MSATQRSNDQPGTIALTSQQIRRRRRQAARGAEDVEAEDIALEASREGVEAGLRRSEQAKRIKRSAAETSEKFDEGDLRVVERDGELIPEPTPAAQRREARESFANDLPLEASEIKVKQQDGSFVLTKGTRREATIEQIAAQSPLEASEIKVTQTDDGFEPTQSTQKQLIKEQVLQERSDLSPGQVEVKQVDGELTPIVTRQKTVTKTKTVTRTVTDKQATGEVKSEVRQKVADQAGEDISPSDVVVEKQGDQFVGRVKSSVLKSQVRQQVASQAGDDISPSDVTVKKEGDSFVGEVKPGVLKSNLRQQVLEEAGSEFSTDDVFVRETDDGSFQAGLEEEAQKREIREDVAKDLDQVKPSEIAVELPEDEDGKAKARVETGEVRSRLKEEFASQTPGLEPEDLDVTRGQLGNFVVAPEDVQAAAKRLEAALEKDLQEIDDQPGRVVPGDESRDIVLEDRTTRGGSEADIDAVDDLRELVIGEDVFAGPNDPEVRDLTEELVSNIARVDASELERTRQAFADISKFTSEQQKVDFIFGEKDPSQTPIVDPGLFGRTGVGIPRERVPGGMELFEAQTAALEARQAVAEETPGVETRDVVAERTTTTTKETTQKLEASEPIETSEIQTSIRQEAVPEIETALERRQRILEEAQTTFSNRRIERAQRERKVGDDINLNIEGGEVQQELETTRQQLETEVTTPGPAARSRQRQQRTTVDRPATDDINRRIEGGEVEVRDTRTGASPIQRRATPDVDEVRTDQRKIQTATFEGITKQAQAAGETIQSEVQTTIQGAQSAVRENAPEAIIAASPTPQVAAGTSRALGVAGKQIESTLDPAVDRFERLTGDIPGSGSSLAPNPDLEREFLDEVRGEVGDRAQAFEEKVTEPFPDEDTAVGAFTGKLAESVGADLETSEGRQITGGAPLPPIGPTSVIAPLRGAQTITAGGTTAETVGGGGGAVAQASRAQQLAGRSISAVDETIRFGQVAGRAGAAAGAALSTGEIPVSKEPTDEQAEIPVDRTTVNERPEIETPQEPVSQDTGEIPVSEEPTVDRAEIEAPEGPGRTGEEIGIPEVEATQALKKRVGEEEEDEEEEQEEDEEEDEDPQVEVPDRFIPDEETVIGATEGEVSEEEGSQEVEQPEPRPQNVPVERSEQLSRDEIPDETLPEQDQQKPIEDTRGPSETTIEEQDTTTEDLDIEVADAPGPPSREFQPVATDQDEGAGPTEIEIDEQTDTDLGTAGPVEREMVDQVTKSRTTQRREESQITETTQESSTAELEAPQAEAAPTADAAIDADLNLDAQSASSTATRVDTALSSQQRMELAQLEAQLLQSQPSTQRTDTLEPNEFREETVEPLEATASGVSPTTPQPRGTPSAPLPSTEIDGDMDTQDGEFERFFKAPIATPEEVASGKLDDVLDDLE